HAIVVFAWKSSVLPLLVRIVIHEGLVSIAVGAAAQLHPILQPDAFLGKQRIRPVELRASGDTVDVASGGQFEGTPPSEWDENLFRNVPPAPSLQVVILRSRHPCRDDANHTV